MIRKINSVRLGHLIEYSFDSPLLDRFLSEKKKALILGGAHADNLPKGHKKRVKFLAALPPKAFEIFRAWAIQVLKDVEVGSGDELLLYFLKIEADLANSDGSHPTRCRQLLKVYFDETSPESIANYLSSPMPDRRTGDGQIDKHESIQDEIADGRSPSWEQGIAEVLKPFVGSKEGDVAVGPLSILIDALLDARDGVDLDVDETLSALREKMPSVSSDSMVMIDGALRTAMQRGKRPRGVLVSTARQLSTAADIDPEDVEVVGRCTKVIDGGTRFIEVLGIKDGASLDVMDRTQAKQVFKESGDLLGYPGGGLRVPELHEWGVWRVEYRDSGKPTKYRIKRFSGYVYQVFQVPHRSDEPDKVRIWLREEFSSLVNVRPIFQLQDGILIRPSGDAHDMSRYDYEKPFDAWESLPGVGYKGLILVLGPLGVSDRKWECTSLVGAVKAVLKHYSDIEGMPVLTHRQIQDLSQHVQELGEGGILSSQARRAESAITQLIEERIEMGEIVDRLMSLPDVKHLIESEKKVVIERFKMEQTDLANEITKLSSRRDSLRDEIRRQEDARKQQVVDLAKAIKKAFEQARSAELDTLAHVALFKGFLADGVQTTASQLPTIVEAEKRIRASSKVISRSPSDIREVLTGVGINREHAAIWKQAIDYFLSMGWGVIVQGGFSSTVLSQLSASVCINKALCIDVPIGLVDSREVQRLIDQDEGIDTICLKNANLSALEAYFGPWLEAVSSSILFGRKDEDRSVLIGVTEGVGSLPIPQSISATFLQLNLDRLHLTPFEGGGEELLEELDAALVSKGVTADSWRRAVRRVVNGIPDLPNVDHSRLLGIVRTSVVETFLSNWTNLAD